MPKSAPFEEHTEEYEAWFSDNPLAYQAELRAMREFIPPSGSGVEIGVGSGRFAAPLGIKYGLEPAESMRKIAEQRGIQTKQGTGENLPYPDHHFDYTVIVTTLCFLDDPLKAFQEAHRILKPAGIFLIGFVDKESPIGQLYQQYKNENVFYRIATFYSVHEVTDQLIHSGFRNIEYRQTLFHSLDDLTDTEPVHPGYGEGSFVVVKAVKM